MKNNHVHNLALPTTETNIKKGIKFSINCFKKWKKTLSKRGWKLNWGQINLRHSEKQNHKGIDI